MVLCVKFVGLWIGMAFLVGQVQAQKSDANMLYHMAMASVDTVSVQESLDAFNKVLEADQDYALAYFEMAKLYLKQNTPIGRQRARTAIERAINIEPDRQSFQLLKGEILWRQGYWHNAAEHYREVLTQFPKSANAAYWAGRYAVRDFFKHKDRREGRVSSESFGEKDLALAISYLKQCLQMDPLYRDAYYQLGMVYFEVDQYDDLIDISNQLLSHMPQDKDALLFCGLGYQALGQYEKAYTYYLSAFDQMSDAERAVMETDTLKPIAEEGVYEHIQARSKNDTTRAWENSQAYQQFWRSQDPLFLTKFNELKMAHYGRVAYANLRFSKPSKKIAGWQTDMGQTWIKYGSYIHRVMSIGAFKEFETWFYEGFSFVFENRDGLDGWVFGPGAVVDLPNPNEDGIAYFRRMRREGELAHSSSERFDNTPPRYIDPYQKYSIPHYVAAFRDRDSIRIELSYLIPKHKLGFNGEGVRFEDGLFLFDQDWSPVYEKRLQADMIWPVTQKVLHSKVDSLRWSFVVSQREILTVPGTYHAVLEIMDQKTRSIGTFRSFRKFAFPDTALSISDILLARDIEAIKPFPEGRHDLKILPNPIRTYGTSEPIFIYLELYHLLMDEFGRTKYNISYRLGQLDPKQVDPRLFYVQDLSHFGGQVYIDDVTKVDSLGNETVVNYRVKYMPADRNKIADDLYQKSTTWGNSTGTMVTAQYEGMNENDFTYLQIDNEQLPQGIYRLIVEVEDVYAKKHMIRDVVFRILE